MEDVLVWKMCGHLRNCKGYICMEDVPVSTSEELWERFRDIRLSALDELKCAGV